MTDEVEDFIGIKPIGEMTKQELIEEIINVNRVNLVASDIDELRMAVVNLRLTDYRKRLIADIGFRTVNGPLGEMVVKDEEDNE